MIFSPKNFLNILNFLNFLKNPQKIAKKILKFLEFPQKILKKSAAKNFLNFPYFLKIS